MTVEELRRQHEIQPFVPLRIHMANGRSVDVDHPRFMMFSRTGRVAYVSTPGDGMESIDLLLISSLEQITKKTAKGRNGKH
jgi:hypothetical protein